MSILEVVGQFFPAQFGGDTWRPWRSLLAAAFGLQGIEDRELLVRLAGGRTVFPAKQVDACYVIAGRRAGKSRAAALVALYMLCFRKYPELVDGERGAFVVVSATKQQAKSVLRYFLALMRSVPMLAELIESETAESVTLTNGLELTVQASSFRSIRGASIVGAVVEEGCFLRTEEDGSALSDTELIAAIEPGMATVREPLLFCISSPHRQQGEMFNAWQRWFGRDDAKDVIVFQSDSKSLNPSLRQSIIDRAYERDPSKASAEFGGLWRTDLEDFMSRERLMSLVEKGVTLRAPKPGVRYFAHVDPAGGSGGDSFTLGISHNEGGVAVLDVVWEWEPPFAPSSVIAEICEVLSEYRVEVVTGDAYAGGFPPEAFKKHGKVYERCAKNRSELYLEMLQLANSSKVLLLDVPKMVTQFTTLERRTSKLGRDSVNHAPQAHDDLCTSVAGALVMASAAPGRDVRVRSF